MKLLKMFGIAVIILSALIISSCTFAPADKAETEQAGKDETIVEKECFGKMGWAVDTDDSAYYWRFTSDDFEDGALFASFYQKESASVELIRLNDGKETVIDECIGAKEFAVTQDGIYYQDNGTIKYADLDGENKKTVANGDIECITEDGKYLIYSCVSEDYTRTINSFNTETSESKFLTEKTSVVAVHDGIVYHTPFIEDYELANMGVLYLYALNPETGDNKLIYASPADPEAYYPVGIAQIRFSDEYICFSYGAIAGTGMFYQEGKFARVKYDGSDAEIIAGENDYPDSEFTVTPDGTITPINVEENDGLYSYLDKYITRDGSIYWFDETTGEPTEICSYFEDGNYDISTASFVNVTDRYAFFVTNHGIYVPENDVGWREYYDRGKSVFYMIDRETGEIVTSYEF